MSPCFGLTRFSTLLAGFYFLILNCCPAIEFQVNDKLTVDGNATLKSTVTIVSQSSQTYILGVKTPSDQFAVYVATGGNVGLGTSAVNGARLAVIGSTDTAYALAVGTDANYYFAISTGGRAQFNGGIYRGTYTVLDSSLLDANGAMKAAGIQNAGDTTGISVSAAPADKVLDFMEYPIDAEAQAAYASNGAGTEASGGTITHAGGKTIHTFTSTGTSSFTVPPGGLNAAYLVVAGGGAGGGEYYGAGGGAGEFKTGSLSLPAGNKTVIVGDKGLGVYANSGGNGGDSVFDTVRSSGGTGGGVYPGDGSGGAVTKGGNGAGAGQCAGGGGAGITNAGSPGNGTYSGGAGGNGASSSISGSAVIYAGGGGGDGSYTTGHYGPGGNGGGGRGAGHIDGSDNAVAGAPNTGGGGGGTDGNFGIYSGADGGTGIVIISYDTPLTYLQSYSESAYKTQGSYSLKVAAAAGALNKTVTRAFSPAVNLSGKTSIKFDMRSSRTGANIKLGLKEGVSVSTEITPGIISPNNWQTITWDVSAVNDANKNAIDSLVITVINADSENTFYIDNMFAVSPGSSTEIVFTTAGSESMRIDTSGNIGIGTANPAAQLDVGGSGSIKIPVGSLAERPASPAAGMMRFNSATGKLELYNGARWGTIALDVPCSAAGGAATEAGGYRTHVFTSSGTLTVTSPGSAAALVVAGGGGGGGGIYLGGGGGAGGLIYTTVNLSAQSYTVTVGAGGAGGVSSTQGSNGENSVFAGISALGGGGGGNYTGGGGKNGGSGGGAPAAQYYSNFGTGTAGQGNNGGTASGSPNYGGGGGGGAGAAGGNGTTTYGGNGGAGLDYSAIFGTGLGDSGWFAGGGGGCGYSSAPPGTGGKGGGGAGSLGDGAPGTANTGGGGGGAERNGTTGGSGGSGIVIIRYPL